MTDVIYAPLHPTAIDRSGCRVGRLDYISYAGKQGRNPMWNCRCECGLTVVTRFETARRDCGCGIYKHGHAVGGRRTSEYAIWAQMRKRCHWPGSRQFYLFQNFLDDMGPKPPGHSLDRIDGNGHYEPTNCRWATHEQQANNRRNNIRLTFHGRTQTASQWARETGVSFGAIRYRLKAGWPVEKILTKAAVSK